ncbi:hypothetical protein D3C81_365280 [compost metagenome]
MATDCIVSTELLQSAINTIEMADNSTGVCCCGNNIDTHGVMEDHGPTDEGDYHAGKVLTELRKALEQTVPEDPELEIIAWRIFAGEDNTLLTDEEEVVEKHQRHLGKAFADWIEPLTNAHKASCYIESLKRIIESLRAKHK